MMFTTETSVFYLLFRIVLWIAIPTARFWPGIYTLMRHNQERSKLSDSTDIELDLKPWGRKKPVTRRTELQQNTA